MPIAGIHHIAIIASDFARSRDFYVRCVGCTVLHHAFREQRQSHKLELLLPGGGQIELFSFPNPPARPTRPEACGLRHLALAVRGLDAEIARLAGLGVVCEAVRTDEFTGKRFTFFADPDGLPIELYELE